MKKNLFRFITFAAIAIATFLAPVQLHLTSDQQATEPTSTQQTYTQITGVEITSNVAHAEIAQISCDTTDLSCSVKNGLLAVFETLWFTTTQIFAAIVAVMLDFILAHSITSSSYSTGIIEKGWEILRDFTNIIFIFSLLLLAFKMVIGQDSGGTKGQLIKTILVALTINFSLFITYTVIDASNILANLFYNRITVTAEEAIGGGGVAGDESASTALKQFFDTLGEDAKSPSVALISTYDPQKIITKSGQTNFSTAFLMIFAAGGLNILTITIFISIILLFLGRTVGLILMGIISPLAFASLTIAGQENMKYIGFRNWFSQLLSMSFMAPVFVFILYLTATFATNAGLLSSVSEFSSENILSTILTVLLPFAFVAVLLMTGKKIATQMAGEIGGVIAEKTSKAIGGAVAVGAVVASGGASLAASGAGGLARLGKKGSAINSFGRTLQAQNFNFGQSRAGKFITNKTGVNMGANLGDMSYARATSGVNNAAASARTTYANLKNPDKKSAAVQAWDDNIAENKDKVNKARLERAQAEEAKKDTTINTGFETDPNTGKLKKDPDTGEFIPKTEPVTNIEEKITELKYQRDSRDPVVAKAEKEAISQQKQEINITIDEKRQTIKNKNSELQQFKKDLKKTPTGSAGAEIWRKIDAHKAEIKKEREAVEKLKTEVEKVEKSSIENQIKQLEDALKDNKTEVTREFVKRRVPKKMTKKEATRLFEADNKN